LTVLHGRVARAVRGSRSRVIPPFLLFLKFPRISWRNKSMCVFMDVNNYKAKTE